MVLLGTSDLNGNVGSLVNQFQPAGSFSNSSFFFSSGPFKGLGAVPPFNTAFESTVTAGSFPAGFEVVNSPPPALVNCNIPLRVCLTSDTPHNHPHTVQA